MAALQQGNEHLGEPLLQRVSQSGHTHSLPGLMLPADSTAHRKLQDLEDREAAANEVERIYLQAEEDRMKDRQGDLLVDLLNISSVLTDGASAMVDDSFLKCFTSMPRDDWNWNAYLFPAWAMGVVFRYCVLFPLRLGLLLASLLVFFILFWGIRAIFRDSPRRRNIERRLVTFQCGMFVASWTGVVKFHGPRPTVAPDRVWVANHTSMTDYILLCSYTPFAVIMQLHGGWVGFLQTAVLQSLGCLWFNRTQAKDRTLVHKLMKEHVANPDNLPLLIFPEGTCVNNEYCVMFKRGAFDIDATVCPIAIKYNKIFVDAFWNSKRISFGQHLIKLMTSWAVVCDVWFLPPQTRRKDESVDDFVSRVQGAIAAKAGLRVVPWDGYLKYYNLGDKHPALIEKRRKVFAERLRCYMGDAPGGSLADGIPEESPKPKSVLAGAPAAADGATAPS